MVARGTKWVAVALVALIGAVLPLGMASADYLKATELGWPKDKEYMNPVKFGSLSSLSGVYDNWGWGQVKGIKLAIKEINAKGGIMGRPVDLIVEDTKINAGVASRKAERMYVKENVDALIGCISSGVTGAVMEIARKYKKLILNGISCNDDMRVDKWNPYYFAFNVDARSQAIALAPYLIKNLGKSYYILGVDYSMGRADARQFKIALEGLGGKILGISWAPLGTKDFTPYFPGILKAKPEVLFISFAGRDSVRVMNQLGEFGFHKKMKIAGIACSLLESDLPAMGPALENYVQVTRFYSGNPKVPGSQEFVRRFRHEYGQNPDMASSTPYEIVYAYKRAVEKAGTTETHAVIKALEGMEWIGPEGKKKLRAQDHAPEYDLWTYKIKGGKLVPLEFTPGAVAVGKPLAGVSQKKAWPGFSWQPTK